MSSDTKILLVGATGRMGQEVAQFAVASGCQVIGGVVEPGNGAIGTKLPNILGPIASKWEADFEQATVIVDFSTEPGTKLAISWALEKRIPMLICTTGLSVELETRIKGASTHIPIVRATNTSVGITAMLKLVELATKMFGSSVDIEISEIHHKFKKDAPSGTALSLAKAVAAARDVDLETVKKFKRAGTDELRKEGEVGVIALRGGNVPGEHTVYFFGENERLEITHRSAGRSVFAEGAIRAASWLVNTKPRPGYYSMADVLALP